MSASRFSLQWLGALALSSLLIAGCGGSSSSDSDGGPSYSGSQSAATVTSNNQLDIAQASRESAYQLITQNEADVDLPFGVSIQGSAELFDLAELSASLVQAAQLPTGIVNQTIQGDCGGSARIRPLNTSGESFRIDYTNFCMNSGDDNVTINGRIDYTSTDTSTTVVYRNVTFTGFGSTQTYNMTITCDETGDNFDCTYTSDFAGSDGRVYRTANATVSGDNDSGYSISARVYDPNHGYVQIEATGLVMCSGGGIGSGTISVTDHTGEVVLSVVFINCSEMTVTFGGESNTYSQL